MNASLKLIVALLLGGSFWFFGNLGGANAWYMPLVGFSVPRLVRFAGILSLPGESNEPLGDTLRVSVNRMEWVFKITKAKDLSGDMTELGLLKSIFPPHMTLRGPDNIIGALLKPEVAGKHLTIRGYLYCGDRVLQVTSIENLETKKG